MQDQDIEAICKAQPELETELRKLHENYLRVREVVDRLGLTDSIADRIAAKYGAMQTLT